jgi:hypothetical protein
MTHTISFEAITGAGGVEVQVTMSFEADKYTSWAENIEMVTYNGMDIMGLMTEEQFAELEAQGIKAIEEQREWEVANYEP